ncbi:hypothetical protein JXA40_05865 [bacterium]|nr:hypothetical protein [candidate division CSSED10-310 bacterium]
MSDVLRVQSLTTLLRWILTEYRTRESIFGIHRSMFYRPRKDSGLGLEDFYGQYLGTPVGPAAGPHTQMAQNIVCAWLSGARFIELKTVQVRDDLIIPRPCIDMEDAGYNVKWSQELKLEQSIREYIHAWVLIRILRRYLGLDEAGIFDTVFNMSVGYDLNGIRSPAMTRFMDTMQDASEPIDEIRRQLQASVPGFAEIDIPVRLTNNVTLSTMHGCPPDEIERIAAHLMESRGLHTIVKLNPTLLGADAVHHILNDSLGYRDIRIPDSVFEKDLQFDEAVKMIRSLRRIGQSRNVVFGVKLSNTLAVSNHRNILPGQEMYLSGRALYPVTMMLFHRLSEVFDGDLRVSFSSGADALNVAEILCAGACPVTVVTDLLKPGGYGRLLQYLESIERVMRKRGVSNLAELWADRRRNLAVTAQDAVRNEQYQKTWHTGGLPRIASDLGLFDCIAAPCTDACAVRQNVPEYAGWIAAGDPRSALQSILSRNPLPGVTGYVCNHLCQTRCKRCSYDQPVAIRALKRFASESADVRWPAGNRLARRIAVVGSGPMPPVFHSLRYMRGSLSQPGELCFPACCKRLYRSDRHLPGNEFPD